jgi:hypothetical protein
MNKYIWIFGGISGLLGALAEYLVYNGTLSFDTFGGVRLFKILAFVFCIIFLSILHKKLNGGISLARVMLNSVLASFVRSAVMITFFLFTYYPEGRAFDDVKKYAFEKSVEMMPEKDRNPKNLTQRKAEIDEQFSIEGYPKFAILGSLVAAVFTGVFLGLILASKPEMKS